MMMSLSDLTGQRDAYQLLDEAREDIRRLQRQVDRLNKDKAKLQSQLLEAIAQVNKAVSDAGWQAEYSRQEALGREERGWK